MKEVDDVGTVALAESRLREHRFDIPKLLLIAQISLFGVHDDVMVIHLYIIDVIFEYPQSPFRCRDNDCVPICFRNLMQRLFQCVEDLILLQGLLEISKCRHFIPL